MFFLGKFLGDANTLRGALDALEKEVQPNHSPPDAKPEYRKALTQSLLYKVQHLLQVFFAKLTLIQVIIYLSN